MNFNDDNHGSDSGGGEFAIVYGKMKEKIWQLSVISFFKIVVSITDVSHFSLLVKVQHISYILSLQSSLCLT